jgi:hypothetical protein
VNPHDKLLRNSTQLYAFRQPGGRLVSLANLTAESGGVYYFRVRTTGGPSSYFKDSDRSASIDLEPVNSDEGKLLVASSAWSSSQPKIQRASK